MNDDDNWRDDSACLNAGPNVMQPDHPTERLLEQAKAFCAECPLATWTACRDLANSHEAYGVWAGEWHGPWQPARLDDLLMPGDWAAFVAAGKTDGAIARELGVSTSQVRYYRQQQDQGRDSAPRSA